MTSPTDTDTKPAPPGWAPSPAGRPVDCAARAEAEEVDVVELIGVLDGVVTSSSPSSTLSVGRTGIVAPGRPPSLTEFSVCTGGGGAATEEEEELEEDDVAGGACV